MEVVEVVLAEVAWMAWVSPSASDEVAVQDEAMYCQKVSLVHCP